jgi:hypothetical protein
MASYETTADFDSAAPESRALELLSPFARFDLYPQPEADGSHAGAEVASPFTEAFAAIGEDHEESQLAQFLVAEFEDEEFAEAVEALANEAAARYLSSPHGWNEETGAPMADPTEATEWMETIAEQTDSFLAELEARFADRSIESVGQEELDQVMREGLPPVTNVIDPRTAQELFWGSLMKKVKKVAGVAKSLAKKGIGVVKRFYPLGILFRALRKFVRPLLNKVLSSAIGKLPESLREPARLLAGRLGLRAAAEFKTPAAYFASEFDFLLADAMVNNDPAGVTELEHEHFPAPHLGSLPNTVEQLDAARHVLTGQLLNAEPGEPPTAAMEQFIPMAVLPLVKTGIAIAGRPRVVGAIAGLLARLIAPIVGKQLAKPLSTQIADKGLATLKLEMEQPNERLGAEALVATLEDTVAEAFAGPPEWLENTLVLEATVQEAFHRAAARHFPLSVLRRGFSNDDDRGLWILMPRATAPVFRYKKYVDPLPLVITRPLAQGVAFSDGETLEDKLADEGVTSWPVHGQLHAFELLPGANVGHLAAGESGNYHAAVDTAQEFDTLARYGNLPLPPDLESHEASRPGAKRKLVRITVDGRRIACRSPFSLRLDLGPVQPTLRLHLRLGERRAQAISEHVQHQRHREIVTVIQSIASPSFRSAVEQRLHLLFERRQMALSPGQVRTLANQLLDGLITAVGSQLPALGGALALAAKDPAPGLTVTAVYQFSSKQAIGTSAPAAPTLTVRPGRHHD